MAVLDGTAELPRWLSCGGPEGDVVISTRIRLARCLAGHLFPAAASLLQRTAAYEEILSAVRAVRRYDDYNLCDFMACTRMQREIMVERRLASPDLLAADGSRGVLVSGDTRVSLMINEEDHVRLQYLDAGCRPQDAWQALSGIDDELGGLLDYAVDAEKGFLTCCPTNAGTGLRISFLVHLPGCILTRTIDQVLQAASQMGIAIRGFFGEHSDVAGSLFQLSNRATLGASEEEYIGMTEETIGRIVRHEREARERILRDAKTELADKAYRAWGILMYARTLSMEELLNLASALRIGVECGIFTQVSVAAINRMILFGMPAHLQAHLGRELTEDECGVCRAERVREIIAAETP